MTAPRTLHKRKAVQHSHKPIAQNSSSEIAMSEGSGICYDAPLDLAFQKPVRWLDRGQE